LVKNITVHAGKAKNVLAPRLPTSSSKNATAKYYQRNLGIYNGVDAVPGDFPHIALLRITRTDNTEYRCAGTLFAYNLVVTAGEFNILWSF
jgi:hypothetical protein